MVQIRAVKETDDFETIYTLINETLQRFTGDPRGTYGVEAEQLKEQYCNPDRLNAAYIAVHDDQTVAFIGIVPSKLTNNGYMECGYLIGYETVLNDLLNCCAKFVRERGGSKIFKFTSAKFGQVRNKGITLWESLGFIADEYANVTTLLDLREWKAPEDFEASGIEAANELDSTKIKQILIEDGEDAMAELIQNQYSPTKEPDQVILTLRDKATNEIAGIAYYKVILSNKGSSNEFLDATAFGLHIRPQYHLNLQEIRRFLQGSLISMKQLNVYHVITRITLKNFNVFSSMVTEGFHNDDLENAHVIRLHKSV